jgi:hypothetical protein
MSKKRDWKEGEKVYINISEPLEPGSEYHRSVQKAATIQTVFQRQISVLCENGKTYLMNRKQLHPAAQVEAWKARLESMMSRIG